MKWIVLAILIVIVPYTIIRWHYRKPGRAFEPYHDMKERANTMRLLEAGFQRITLEADRPSEPMKPAAATAPISSAPGGLPSALANSLVEPPRLADEILTVSAAPTANVMLPYTIGLTCAAPDHKQQLVGAHLYVRSDEIHILPLFEKLDGELLARSRQSQVRLTVPSGSLKPGSYRVTLVGARTSKTWPLEVR